MAREPLLDIYGDNDDDLEFQLKIFHDDTLSPPKVKFCGKIQLYEEKIDCYIALGMKYILFSLSNTFTKIFDIMIINEAFPRLKSEGEILEMQDKNCEILRKFTFEVDKNSLLLKNHLINFRKPNSVPRLELNPKPTLAYPNGYKNLILDSIEELEQLIEDMEAEGEEEEESDYNDSMSGDDVYEAFHGQGDSFG